MKKEWTLQELFERFTLSSDEVRWLSPQASHNQLGLAVFLKMFQYQGRFPRRALEVAEVVVDHLASQLQLSPEVFKKYDWKGRTAPSHRQWVRDRLNIREATAEDGEQLGLWLSEHPILYQDQRLEVLVDRFCCKNIVAELFCGISR